MSTTHKFTVKTAVLDEVYTINHSRNLCSIRKAWYPIKECIDGCTELFATTPSVLANFLLEDNVPFSYESYDIAKTNAELYEDLVTEYEKRGQKLEDLIADHKELKAEISALKASNTDLHHRLAQIKQYV